MLALWIGLGLLLLLGAGYLAWSRVFVPAVEVPNVVRQPRDAAVATLRQAGFDPVVSDSVEFSLDVPRGAVAAQQPAGTARRGARVTLTLSGGPRPINGGVPPVTGFSEDRAVATLRQTGLDPRVERQFDDQIPEGIVIRTEPGPGGPVVEGQPVKVTVSRGPQPIEVPRVVGLQQTDASAAISSAGLRPVVVEELFNDAAAGTVLSQTPDAGATLQRGDRVELRVSKGPQTVTMPDVRGKKRDDAVKQLEGLGLRVNVREVQGLFRSSGTIYEQDPKPGTSVRRGETVTVYVWK